MDDNGIRTTIEYTINDEGIEMEDRATARKDYHRREQNGTLDTRDPMEIAGGEEASGSPWVAYAGGRGCLLLVSGLAERIIV